MTRFQFFARNQNAFSDECSQTRQQPTTAKSRIVIENQFRQ